MRYSILILGICLMGVLPASEAHGIGGRWRKNTNRDPQPQLQTPQHAGVDSGVLSDRPGIEIKAPPTKNAGARDGDPEEDVIADLILAKRLIKIPRHPALDAAARERACVSAKEGTLSHFDQFGRGPNFYVKKNGFPFEGADGGNQVESIAWGNTSGIGAWYSWMNSPHHRDHITARGFSASHTHFGVGHCVGPKGNHVWTVVSAPISK